MFVISWVNPDPYNPIVRFLVNATEPVLWRIRRALPHVPAERIIVAPDCGMKYLPRDVAFAKMKAMVEGAAIVRREVE